MENCLVGPCTSRSLWLQLKYQPRKHSFQVSKAERGASKLILVAGKIQLPIVQRFPVPRYLLAECFLNFLPYGPPNGILFNQNERVREIKQHTQKKTSFILQYNYGNGIILLYYILIFMHESLGSAHTEGKDISLKYQEIRISGNYFTVSQSHIFFYLHKLFILFLLFCYVFLEFSAPESHNSGHLIHSLLLSSELFWEILSESFCLRCMEIHFKQHLMNTSINNKYQNYDSKISFH